VLLYVYRLRRRGERQTRADMAMEGLRGDLILEPYQAGWRGRPMLLAYLFEAGGAHAELLPRLEGARVARVREALTIVGMEAVPRGRKNVERYRQTWVCTADPVAADRWPDRPRVTSSCITSFDPADDDYA
jgi:hypothetical protein